MTRHSLRKKKGNVILHGLVPGFGLPRVIRSRLRRRYEKKYRMKHRSPRVVFIFDAALAIAVAALLALVVSIVVSPPQPPTIQMSFAAPAFEATKPIPMVARLTPTDDREHSNVSVRWHIPLGWEVLESDPPMRRDGTVFLGTLLPGQERTSRVIARMFLPVGHESAIGFTVRNVENGVVKRYTAIEERDIRSSALTAGIPSAFNVDAVTPNGAVVPIEVRNTTDRTIPFVELRSTETSSVPFPRTALGDLEPNETRYVPIPLDSAGEPLKLEWALFAASREILKDSWSASVVTWDDPVIERPLIANPNEDSIVRAHGGEGISLIFVQPFREDALREVSIHREVEDITIPAADIDVTPQQRWFVAPVSLNERGERVLGPATFGVFTASFPFSAEVRYTTDAGDQLGLGPHPPRALEETRYWVFWNVGPVQGSLQNVRVETTVPRHVKLTGSIASPHGGSSMISGRKIRWTLPELGSEVGIPEAYFGFEIAIIPQESDVGNVLELSGPSYAAAFDAGSGMALKAEETALYSQLLDNGGGIVQPAVFEER